MTAKYLIINADDYGYYSCVSKGILQGVKHGSITATGIMANSQHFEEHIDWVKNYPELDKGVHLNISHGRPLSSELAGYLEQGLFADKTAIVGAILTARIPIQVIENEWRMQIERCLQYNVDICFLNSHEHLHMLPPLYRVFNKLLNEYQIIQGRYTQAEWHTPMSPGAVIRNSALSLINIFNRSAQNNKPPRLLGVNDSGNLNMAYLQKVFATLKQGCVYELMCHPGYFDSQEITAPELLSYHNWEGEMNLLLSEEFSQLCDREEIRLINYRKLNQLKIH